VFALQANTGSTLWAYPAVQQRSGGGLLGGCSGPTATDGPFHSAPAFDPENLYLGSAGEQQRSLFGQSTNNSGLRTLNKTGMLQWEFKGTTDRTVSSPAISGTTVYLASSDHNVYAIDTETRQARWTLETKNWVWSTPLVVEDKVYIASMDHALYAVDDADGSVLWTFAGAPGALPAAPAIAQDVLYFGSLAGHMYAV
jgi:outer membrane protein assembly factor BamB